MFKINSWPYSFQTDVIMMPHPAGSNGGKTCFLLFVDNLSRKAFAYALQGPAMMHVTKAYRQFLAEAMHKIRTIHVLCQQPNWLLLLSLLPPALRSSSSRPPEPSLAPT
jgi:hypothetical protein